MLVFVHCDLKPVVEPLAQDLGLDPGTLYWISRIEDLAKHKHKIDAADEAFLVLRQATPALVDQVVDSGGGGLVPVEWDLAPDQVEKLLWQMAGAARSNHSLVWYAAAALLLLSIAFLPRLIAPAPPEPGVAGPPRTESGAPAGAAIKGAEGIATLTINRVPTGSDAYRTSTASTMAPVLAPTPPALDNCFVDLADDAHRLAFGNDLSARVEKWSRGARAGPLSLATTAEEWAPPAPITLHGRVASSAEGRYLSVALCTNVAGKHGYWVLDANKPLTLAAGRANSDDCDGAAIVDGGATLAVHHCGLRPGTRGETALYMVLSDAPLDAQRLDRLASLPRGDVDITGPYYLKTGSFQPPPFSPLPADSRIVLVSPATRAAVPWQTVAVGRYSSSVMAVVFAVLNSQRADAGAAGGDFYIQETVAIAMPGDEVRLALRVGANERTVDTLGLRLWACGVPPGARLEDLNEALASHGFIAADANATSPGAIAPWGKHCVISHAHTVFTEAR